MALHRPYNAAWRMKQAHAGDWSVTMKKISFIELDDALRRAVVLRAKHPLLRLSHCSRLPDKDKLVGH